MITAAPAAPSGAQPPHPWEELAFASRFIVWTMRLWLAANGGDPQGAHRFGCAFDKIGGGPAAASLDLLMATIADGAHCAVALAPVHSPWLTADEVRLVDAVALAQGDDAIDVLMVLRPYLTPEGCRRVRRPLRAFARALADAGLILPVPQGGGASDGSGHVGSVGDPALSRRSIAGTNP